MVVKKIFKSDKADNSKLSVDKKLEIAVSIVEKHCGGGTIIRMDKNSVKPINSIPTGSYSLNKALGIGGLPEGRVIEIFGPESSGKTTLALSTIAEAQKLGKICAFIDAEHALDINYAKKLGVNINELLVSQPDYGEQALEIADVLIQKNIVDLIVVDSVAALVPKAEIEGEMTDQQVGLQARLMSKGLRKITAGSSKNGTTVIFINQIRMKIGVMFGSPETTTGGNALKFFSSVRLDIRKTGQIKDGDRISGNKIKVKVVKNKTAPPFRIAEFELDYDKGFWKTKEIVDIALKNKLIEQAGSWYSYKNTRLGQGKDNACIFLESNPSILKELEKELENQ